MQLNPTHDAHLPQSAPEIFARLNTIVFNASLLREMEMVAFARRRSHSDKTRPGRGVGSAAALDARVRQGVSPSRTFHKAAIASRRTGVDPDYGTSGLIGATRFTPTD